MKRKDGHYQHSPPSHDHNHNNNNILQVATTTTSNGHHDENGAAPPRPFYRRRMMTPRQSSWCWALTMLLVMVGALLNADMKVLQSLLQFSKPPTTAASSPTTTSHNNNAMNVETPKTNRPQQQQQQQKFVSKETFQGNSNQQKSLALPQDDSTQDALLTDAKTTTTTTITNEDDKMTKATSSSTADGTLTTTQNTFMTTKVGSSSPATFPIRYRSPKLNATMKKALADTWGQWNLLTDPKASSRPASLPCQDYDHCDVPRSQFPHNAWQNDKDFLESFLTQAQDLVTRAQEAILAEYGQSKFDLPEKSLAERSMNFQLDHLHLHDDGIHPPDPKKVNVDNGGWTTPRSFQGLVRRLLHAIMTQDTFTFALGGHSIAAGHGNLFKQSYAMQFHRVMEPVFARLGVTLVSHNFGKGGIGTTQDSLGMGTLWGKEIDFCMWDSGMTEKSSAHYDLFARQALISGNRVPILWNGFLEMLEIYHNQADVDVGGPGTGLRGIPVTESNEHASKLPYAVRYMKCTQDRKDLCDEHKYNGRCWVHRPDFTPPVKQGFGPGSGGSHHPGFRTHQLLGRVLAFTILTALQEGVTQWKHAPNYELPDAAWHVSAHYQNIRTKLAKLTNTPCFNDTTIPTPRVCTIPMKGVSEYTPRPHPEQNSIRSIMTDTSYIQLPPANIYFGPDVYNPALEPPEGEINYLAIVENDALPPTKASRQRRLLSDHESWLVPFSNQELETRDTKHVLRRRRLENTALTVGRGWALHISKDDIPCNGTYDSECSRQPGSSCLLYGTNDGKGGLVFDSLSGWLLMRLKAVKEGLIIIKLETWQHKNHQGGWAPVESSELTEGWTEENNGITSKSRNLRDMTMPQNTSVSIKRQLAGSSSTAPPLCSEFKFEFAINGRIQSWSKDEFLRKRIFVQPVVETWTLLEDPNFTKDDVDVELGIRMQGCKRINNFKLTHVYWA